MKYLKCAVLITLLRQNPVHWRTDRHVRTVNRYFDLMGLVQSTCNCGKIQNIDFSPNTVLNILMYKSPFYVIMYKRWYILRS